MFLWDIAPWMRQTTTQLNSILVNQHTIIDLLMQLTPKDLSPEQQRMLNQIYERAINTRAKIDSTLPKE